MQRVRMLLLTLSVVLAGQALAQTTVQIPQAGAFIPEVIDALSSGDTIEITAVHPDSTQYKAFVLDKAITIKNVSAGSIVIDAAPSNAAWAARITDSGGSIEGFELWGRSGGTGILDVGGGTVTDCTLKDKGYTMGTDGAVLVSGGTLSDCTVEVTSGRGRAVTIDGSGADVTDNVLTVTLVSTESEKEGILCDEDYGTSADVLRNTITFTGSDAGSGRSMVLSPSQAAAVTDGENVRVPLVFDLGAVPAGAVIHEATLDWVVSGVSSEARTEFTAHAVTESWTVAGLASSGLPDVEESPAAEWDIAPRDYSRTGGLVRMYLREVVAGWLASPSSNHGVVLTLPGFSAAAVAGQVSAATLTVRWSDGD